MEEVGARDVVAVELVSRVQMRAIFSGLAVAIGCLAVCLGLSWAIGLSTYQPTAQHARGLALYNTIWGAVALWISIFAGAYVSALVGRATDRRGGILHGLTLWGALAGVLGLFIALLLGGFLLSLLQASGTTFPDGTVPHMVTLRRLAHVAGLTLWLYWAGIVGGLFTSVAGGWLGARNQSPAPRRIGVKVPQPVAPPIVPQPA
jgi:hypothetical protein